jgi:hypothetical protein
MKRNSCLLWNYILRVILSFDAFSFCCWATNLQGFAARTLHANILCCTFSMALSKSEFHRKGWNPSHVVITYNSVLFFFACHRNRKRIHFNPSLQKPFFLACTKQTPTTWPALECDTEKSTELGNEHTWRSLQVINPFHDKP